MPSNKLYYTVLVLATFLIHCKLMAQDTIRQHYVFINANTAYNSVYDMGYSSLLYKGLEASGKIGYQVNGKKNIHQIDIGGGLGVMQNESQYSNNSITNYNALFRYIYFRKKQIQLPLEVYLQIGGTINHEYQLRILSLFSNNAYQQEFHGNLGPTAKLIRKFMWREKKIAGSLSFNLPLFAWYIRPGFSTNLPFEIVSGTEKPFQGYLKSIDLVSWGKYQYWNIETSFEYELRNKNRISISHIYKFYRIESANTVSAVKHEIGISLFTNIK